MDLANHSSRNRLIYLLLIASTLLAYHRVGEYDMLLLDDMFYVFSNPYIREGLTWDVIQWAFSADWLFASINADYWQPVTFLSRMLDIEWFGLDPSGHHLMNLGFHILNTLLLFFVFHKMTRSAARSAVVAALFALHPLHVESVAWITARKDLLSGFFWALTIWAYLRYIALRRWRRYGLVLMMFALGLLAKPMGITLPFVLLLLDYWPLNRIRNGTRSVWARLILEKCPLIALSVCSIAISSKSADILHQTSWFVGFKNGVVSYIVCLWKTVCPYNLALHCAHPEASWSILIVIGSSLLLILISYASIYFARARPWFFVGWWWFVVVLVPVVGFSDISNPDRFTYLPLTGVFLVAVWGAADLFPIGRWRRQALIALAGMVLILFLIGTRLQARYWRNSVTLFERTVQVTPDDWDAHGLLGDALLGQGMLDGAMFHYGEVWRLKPNSAEAHEKLGDGFFAIRKLDEAIFHYQSAARLERDSNNIRNVHVYFQLGSLFSMQGKIRESIEQYQKAFYKWPDKAETSNNLAWILATTDDPNFRNGTMAVYFAKICCHLINYKDSEKLDTLAAAYAENGQFDEALKTAQKALEMRDSFTREGLISEIQNRVKFYKRKQPWHEHPK